MMADLDNKYITKSLSEHDIKVLIDHNQYKAKFLVDDKFIELYIILDDTFPYEFPIVHIELNSQNYLEGLPHIEEKERICCFDKSKTFSDPTHPENIIIAGFCQAKKIVEKDLCGDNNEDYLDEFCTYWHNASSSDYQFYLLSELSSECSVLYCNFNSTAFVHYDIKTLKEKLDELQINHNDKDIKKCFYVPLNKPISHIPKSHEEIDSIIKSNSYYYKDYEEFLTKEYPRGHLIILSQQYNNSYMYFGFLHERIPQIPGFREGHTPLGVSLKVRLGKAPITKFAVSNLTQSRLFSRGGDGIINETHIGVVGCGSLGSHIVDAFASCGTFNFTLIDNQLLSEDNIARHICGFELVGIHKSKALKFTIQQHNPNINCKDYTEDVNLLLENRLDVFDATDTIVCTVAEAPLEMHLVEKYNEGCLCKTLVIMWVEPYALCGHIVLLNKPQDIFSELYDVKLNFNEPVIKSSDNYYKREAGCNSTYMPYSGLNVKLFVGSFVKDFMQGRYLDNNYHIIWSGDLHNNGFGVEINSKWSHLRDNSVYVERIG
ncbi:MAG: ThiF family adenylyltransferase [Eubacterium sp.]|nr:ThiF family adenylyltransferase [Eubacterium sp.]